MERREFMAAASVAGLTCLGRISAGAGEGPAGPRDIYELKQYHLETTSQKELLDPFMADAFIPACNRIGIKPVGVFYPPEELSPVRVLLRHPSIASVVSNTQKLLADEEFLKKGAAFLDAPAANPAYKRMESSLMLAFESMPRLETPITAPGRILQLRIYESPNVKTGQKKIEMFNKGEIEIFRKTGLHPVFFGESLSGSKLPNLTYMLVFENMEEKDKNWKQFIDSPEWKKLSAIPEYANDRIISNITNILLKPAGYSQI
ncbi:MAG: NIPSNAP family protein [Sedimentisphaerales bacterium]|nr:NIPSNAP family protein [Sedimentisphaerales bacterium]